MRLVSIALAVLALAPLSTQAAPTAPKANRERPAAPESAANGAPVGNGAPGPNEGVPQFRPPPVSDPMLETPEAAPTQIASWDEALDLIRRKSPDYLANFQTIAAAEGQTRAALGAVLPTLAAQGAYTHQFYQATYPIGAMTITTPPQNVLMVTGAAQWNLLNPRGLYAVGTAKKNVEVQKLAFEDRRRLIATRAVAAMLQTLANERVAELNRVGLRTALERLVLTQTRFQFGQGTQLDIDRAQQDVANARSQIVSGDENLRQAREALGVALGSPTPISAPSTLDLEGFEAGVAKTCHLNAEIEKRPDILAAKSRVELAARAIRDAELEFAPYLAASSTFTHSNVAVLGPVTTWNLGGAITLPLYDGGVRYGHLRTARAQAENARQNFENTRLNAIVSSARAERGVKVTKDSRDVAQQQRDLAARVDARTRDGYARGLGTSLDLVTSAQALRASDINLAVLDFQVAQARANAVLQNAECVY